MRRRPMTQLLVDKLRPDPRRQIERPDHLYPQLRLVLYPTGSRSWAVRTRIHGKPCKITLPPGLDLKAARDAYRDIARRIAAGEDPRRPRRRALTLGETVESYLRAIGGDVRPKTLSERTRYLRRDFEPLHGRPLAEIGKAELAALLLALKESVGGIAANRARSALGGLFAWATAMGLCEVNPVTSTKPPLRREVSRDRVLSPDERREVWEATADGGQFEAVVRLLLMLGQRRQEVAGMRWAEVDLAKSMWSLPAARAKNGLAHSIPLPRQAVAILEAQPKRGEFVFGIAAAFVGFARGKRRLDQRMNPMPNWVLHDLRRTFVTALNEELGVAPHIVESIVNHQSGPAKRGPAGVYNRAAYMKERALALQAWADRLEQAPVEKVVDLRKRAG